MHVSSILKLYVFDISTEEDDLDETFNTLEYAQRTQNIKNKPTKNVSRSFQSPQKEPVAFEMYSDSEEETEFKKMYALMKRKSSKISEANNCIHLLRVELDEANNRIAEIESMQCKEVVRVSTFTQTEILNAEEKAKFIPKSSSMDLFEMHNLTPAIIMNHMYSSVTLIDEEIDEPLTRPEDQQLLKIKADFTKNSSKHAKE